MFVSRVHKSRWTLIVFAHVQEPDMWQINKPGVNIFIGVIISVIFSVLVSILSEDSGLLHMEESFAILCLLAGAVSVIPFAVRLEKAPFILPFSMSLIFILVATFVKFGEGL